MQYKKIKALSVSEGMMRVRSLYGPEAIILGTKEIKAKGFLGSTLFSKKMYEVDFMLKENMENGNKKENTKESRIDLENSSLKNSFSSGKVRERKKTPLFSSNSTPPLSSPSNAKQNFLEHDDLPISKKQVANVGAELAKTISQNILGQEKLSSSLSEKHLQDKKPNHLSTSTRLSQKEFSSLIKAKQVTSPLLSNSFELVDKENYAQEVSKNLNFSHKDKDENLFFYDLDKKEIVGTAPYLSSTPMFEMHDKLLAAQLSPPYVDKIMRSLTENLSKSSQNDATSVQKACVAELAKRIEIMESSFFFKETKPSVLSFIGPSGMGKTTLLGKVAYDLHFKRNLSTSILSLDHRRLGATEQLKAYATVIGLNFCAPISLQDLREYLKKNEAKVILVDTAGSHHNDSDEIKKLKNYFELLQKNRKNQKILVLSANMNPKSIQNLLLNYDKLAYEGIALTHLDETEYFAQFIESADNLGKIFSFFNSNQDTLSDLEVFSPEELAKLILDKLPRN